MTPTTFLLTEAAFVEGQQLTARTRPGYRIMAAVGLALLVAGLAEAAYRTSQGGVVPHHDEQAVVAGGLLLAWSIWRMTWGEARSAAAFYRRTDGADGQVTVSWDDRRLELSDDYTSKEIAWSDFEGFAESPRILVMRTRRGAAWTLPKAAFTDANLTDLRERLAAGGGVGRR